ncbi:MAG: ATP-dependent RecD-like DNA helicase [Eubacteriales bacterium]|nr:ATP-dependent RecD-like DNA helicase [Eubacteriales bacterium]
MEQELLSINGTVDTVIYQNEDNGYAVIRLIADDGEEVTAVGTLPQICLGEELMLTGHWVTHASYGEQFQTDYFERRMPATVKGIADYLSSGIIKGIGPKLARKIADRFGEETFSVMANEPERLSSITGITARKAEAIGEQFRHQTSMRRLMEFLMENQLPPQLAARLYKRYKDTAIDHVLENPYLLCGEDFAVSFDLADHLALSQGMPWDSTERIQAGILYTLQFNLSNGHTFIPKNKLLATAGKLLQDQDGFEPEAEVLEANFTQLQDMGQLVCENICRREAVYLNPMHEAEVYVSDYLAELSDTQYEYEFDIGELLDTLEQNGAITYAPRQRQAIEWAAKYGLVILTGGPGTGKTTTVRGMLEFYDAIGLDVVLAAPTGRAAKRLSELCGREAKTIHRLLEAGYRGAETRAVFARNKENPLECDVVILDEVSMIDIVLMQALLEALRPGTRLVLVGDADQLPPVGPGNFLRDCIGSNRIHTIELDEIFRQAQQSAIVRNAHAINHGEMPVGGGRDGDFFIMKQRRPEDVMQTVVELCRKRLPDYYGFTPDQIQVLTPSRKQAAGTQQLNRMLQEALNPPDAAKPEKRYGDTVFRLGDRVMQVRNNYDIVWEKEDNPAEDGSGMFNGDVGRIVGISLTEENMLIQFDDKLAHYTFDMLGELELAYAMTVHKSQGSEFEAVIVALPSGVGKRLQTRNILYTAITRAKKLLVLVGDPQVTETMVNTNTRNRRYSALRARLIRSMPEPEQIGIGEE